MLAGLTASGQDSSRVSVTTDTNGVLLAPSKFFQANQAALSNALITFAASANTNQVWPVAGNNTTTSTNANQVTVNADVSHLEVNAASNSVLAVANTKASTNAPTIFSPQFPNGVTIGTSGNLIGGANLIEQQNGTSRQTFNVYQSFTDASNYKRLSTWFSGSDYMTTAEGSGTGTNTGDWYFKIAGPHSLRFWTKETERWRIGNDGTFDAGTDNSWDIGRIGANRPRTIYAGTSVISPLFTGDGSGITNLTHGPTVSAVSGVTITPTMNPDGSTNYALTVTATGTGNVVGPSSATDGTFPLFMGTGGSQITNRNVTGTFGPSSFDVSGAATAATNSISLASGLSAFRGTNTFAPTNVATASVAGLVKVDGTTITVTSDGTISSTTGGGGNVSGSGASTSGHFAQFNNGSATAITDSGFSASSFDSANAALNATNGINTAAYWPSNHFATTNVATPTTTGPVKVDNSTIVVAADGTISSAVGGGNVNGSGASTAGHFALMANTSATLITNASVSPSDFDSAGSATSATNAIGTLSGVSAFVSTNRFDVSGAATAATNAQQAVINKKADTNNPAIAFPNIFNGTNINSLMVVTNAGVDDGTGNIVVPLTNLITAKIGGNVVGSLKVGHTDFNSHSDTFGFEFDVTDDDSAGFPTAFPALVISGYGYIYLPTAGFRFEVGDDGEGLVQVVDSLGSYQTVIDGTNLLGHLVNIPSTVVTNNGPNTITGDVTVNGAVSGTSIAVTSATASTMAVYDAGKNLVSIANPGVSGTFVVTNDGVGHFGQAPAINGSALKASQYVSTDASTNLISTLNGSSWTNLTGTNIVLDTSILAATSNGTNYTAVLRPGLPGMQTIITDKTNVNLSLVGTNLADVGRSVFINNFTNLANCNITFTFTAVTNFNFSAVVSNGWAGVFNFWNADTSGTNVLVSDAGRYHH